MLDLVIEGGTVVDGSGAVPFAADVGVAGGRIVEMGRVTSPARERIDARGAWVTPGFVDIHTHYDGQACWDETFSPSIQHGVTTLVMGNCGVGFAPHLSGRQDELISLMQGVEDIPGVALAEGVPFAWQSFTEYMDWLEARPRSLDCLVQVPHDPLRMAVMKDRALAQEAATPDDIGQMRQLLRQALEAGAAGFSTGRTDNHRTARGAETPASEASAAELAGLGAAFHGLGHGVVQVVSDFDLLRGPERFDAEFDLVERLAEAAGRPLSMTWMQRDPGGDQWQAIRTRTEAAVARGLPLYLQAAARGIGVIIGLEASFHPFMGFPGYKEVAHLPLPDRMAALRDPARKARILAERSEPLSGDGTPVPPLVDILLARIELIAGRMFPLGEVPDYEPTLAASFAARARQLGCSALEALYDHFTRGDGQQLVYFPIFNYNGGNLDVVREMIDAPNTLIGLGDGGAHVGIMCDATATSYTLTHWTRDRAKDRARGSLFPVAWAIKRLTADNAIEVGLRDRGVLKPGLKADINVIDYDNMRLRRPEIVYDLPAGGKRLVQRTDGFDATIVSGSIVYRDGEPTGALPGRLIRSR